ncbi:hypothetical protein FEM48_Zijuj07G0120600 [Ziziphus jujuba var. spinosa]|uniref:Uncharacterized protein n=1 Tax=Ziziphus jujuba var. spinosa TaxID=714518 RepID=A0A978V4I7_ZIZJJ|nr:hypothetical protein FEM48_Zijuj07G0120600 [Ziziphus jujuba var. spinosa]
MALCTKVSFRVKVLDCYIDICSPEVLIIFTYNFDYQHLWCHFVKGLLVDDMSSIVAKLLQSFSLSWLAAFGVLQDFGLQQIQKVVGLQLFIASLAILALNSSYSSSQPVPSSLAKIELPYFTIEITSPSSPFTLSLAKRLQSIGAKTYGAFWCSHYLEQKQMKLPLGFLPSRHFIFSPFEIHPFLIKDGCFLQVLSGEQELSNLAQASGFDVK